MKKLDKLLTKILIFSLILFLFSFFFTKARRNAPKSIESALLNPKYKNEIAQIEIQITSQNGAITLKKQGDFWLLVKNAGEGKAEITTFADKKLLTSLIEKACEIRKLYQISDKESDFDQLKTSENTARTVTFTGNNDKMYTKLHFGAANSLTNRTFVRSQGSKITYETENDLSQFLNSDTNYWSQGEILAGLLDERANLVEITFKKQDFPKKSVNRDSKLDEKSPDFNAKSNTLVSLRHGSIQSMWDDRSLKTLSPDSILTAQSGNGRQIELRFFKISNPETNEESYFYTRSLKPSPVVDSQENSFAFYSENAVYEISAWTYDRIIALFYSL